MEYCGIYIDHEAGRRRLTSTFCTILATICVVGTACEMPTLDYGDTAYVNEEAAEVRNGVSKGFALKMDRTEGLSGVLALGLLPDTFHMLPEVSVGDYVVVPDIPARPVILDISAGAVVPSEPMIPDIPSEPMAPVIPSEPMIPVIPSEPMIPDVPSEPIAPDIPSEPIAPDVPSDPVVPNVPSEPVIPDVPSDPIVPDIPSEPVVPDTPIDPVPDSPSDGTGTIPDALAGFQVNEEGMIYAITSEEAVIDEDGSMELPDEGCTGILGSAFAGAEISDLVIPPNITYIEEGAFSGIPDLFGIWVDEDNPVYTSMDAILFDKEMTTLLAFPGGRVGTYELPEGVTRIADYAFANTGLEKISLRRCKGLIEIGSAAFGESNGAGLTISVPRNMLSEYEELLAGFDVILE